MGQRSDSTTGSQARCGGERNAHEHARGERSERGSRSELELEDFLVSYHELVGKAAAQQAQLHGRRRS